MSIQKLSFQWDIKNFDDCDLVSNEFFDSPRFFTADPTLKSEWKLRLYPAGFKVQTQQNGEQIEEKSKNLFLFLLRLDSGSSFHTHHSISFLNRNGSQIITKNRFKLCVPSKFTDSTEKILSAENNIEIFRNAYRYTDGGVLSVV